MIEESKMDIKEMTRQLEIIFENQIERDYQSFYKYRPKNRHPITSSRISGENYDLGSKNIKKNSI